MRMKIFLSMLNNSFEGCLFWPCVSSPFLGPRKPNIHSTMDGLEYMILCRQFQYSSFVPYTSSLFQLMMLVLLGCLLINPRVVFFNFQRSDRYLLSLHGRDLQNVFTNIKIEISIILIGGNLVKFLCWKCHFILMMFISAGVPSLSLYCATNCNS